MTATTDTRLDLEEIGCEWLTPEQPTGDPRSVISSLMTEVERLRRDLELAVAHDRQPYPTADAYEAACHALEFYRGIADEATVELERSSINPDAARTLRRRFEGGAGMVDLPSAGSLAARLTAAETEVARLRHLEDTARAAVELLEMGDCVSMECPGAGEPTTEATCIECSALNALAAALPVREVTDGA